MLYFHYPLCDVRYSPSYAPTTRCVISGTDLVYAALTRYAESSTDLGYAASTRTGSDFGEYGHGMRLNLRFVPGSGWSALIPGYNAAFCSLRKPAAMPGTDVAVCFVPGRWSRCKAVVPRWDHGYRAMKSLRMWYQRLVPLRTAFSAPLHLEQLANTTVLAGYGQLRYLPTRFLSYARVSGTAVVLCGTDIAYGGMRCPVQCYAMPRTRPESSPIGRYAYPTPCPAYGAMRCPVLP
eukprot:605495-Rhodomonas_salina.1